ncbi:MAG: hypothetical protein TREMPRED_002603 [Tremellales sp. Tagirdzhanova-0007]|nr:MAG: hypothetical protein TREMPRED_002603 [Tremellales sp. Tagirdzhanova-0007]
MPAASPTTAFEDLYNPKGMLKHPDFRVLEATDRLELDDPSFNIACAYNPAHEIQMVNKPVPKPGPGEVVIHVRATGICGSDVHFWKHGQIGPTMVVKDVTGAGHESAGDVIELGEGVTTFAVGDRVAIESGLPCGKAACDSCRMGRYNLCPNVVFFSVPPYFGTLTRFHAHPAGWLHKLPDGVSFEEGSLCEPLAVALAGIERADVRLGDPVLICGAGPIGLITLLAANAAGCTPIVITDLFESRLAFAKTLVPRVHTVQIQRGQSESDTAKMVKEKVDMSFKVALECTGVESSICIAIYSVQLGGKVFVIGVGPSEIKYPKAIRLISSGLINVKPLVTHRFTLAKAVDAFHIAADPSKGAIKVQILD